MAAEAAMDVALLGAAAADAEELGSAARFFLRVYKPVAFSPSTLSAVALSGVSLASCGAVAFALAVAVRQAGLAGPHATAYCSARVSGWWIVQMFLVFLDFVLMLRSIRDPARPRPWDRDASVGAIQKAFARGWSNLIIGSTLSVLPPLLWVRHGGLRTFGPACILVVLYGVFNSSLTAVEWDYKAEIVTEAQEGLEEVLATGGPGLKVGDALELYASVNATRKKVAHAFERHMSTVFPVYTLGMLIALYDFELMPWGQWPVGLAFAFNALSLVGLLEPFIGMNGWPSRLQAKVMESSGLQWAPGERTDFCAHVAATKVSVEFGEFEMGKGFRTALPAFFFGWWICEYTRPPRRD